MGKVKVEFCGVTLNVPAKEVGNYERIGYKRVLPKMQTIVAVPEKPKRKAEKAQE
jgi:hypothetical protein